MRQKETLTVERLKEVLNYDPATGVFRWKVKAARNTVIGSVAGSKVGKFYRYIKIDEVDYLAARLAWLHENGSWCQGPIRFKDGDKLNCAIDNLMASNSLSAKFDCRTKEGRNAYLREHRKQFPEAYRGSQLKSQFGITVADYDRMLSSQNGCCAICKGPEVVMRGGRLKALAVDHNHKAGGVRKLLCQACNMMIGYSREAPEVLREAALYLERHATEVEDMNTLSDLARSSAELH